VLKKATVIASLLLILIVGSILYAVIVPLSKEGGVEEMEMVQKEGKYPIEQTRSNVTKDLWIHDAQMGRLHHHIESPRSTLIAYTKNRRIHLIEQMHGMKCYLQEKVEDINGELIQQIRFIESKEGTYRYSSQQFNTQSVFLALFRIPGDTLSTKLDIKKAFLVGVAKEVSLSFSGNKPNFHAQNFKAQIRPQGSISSSL